MTNEQLDAKSEEILRHLLRNSRLSYREIAKRTGFSIGTVLNRMRELGRAGVIREYSAVLDHEKLGYELTVITEIIVSKGKLLDVEKDISKFPGVCAVYDVTGTSDAMVIAKFRNRLELSRFTKQMLSLPFVERSNTHVVLNTVKEDFRLV